VTSLPTTIGVLGSSLGPYPESDQDTDLYSSSSPIAIMDESDHRINFNYHNKSAISLLAAIEASDSPLGPHPESDLATDLYFGYQDKSNRRISFKQFQEIYNITTRGDEDLALSSRNPSRIDLTTDLYSGSALAAHYNKMGPSNSSDLFRLLNT
jgi:hypothetical protein